MSHNYKYLYKKTQIINTMKNVMKNFNEYVGDILLEANHQIKLIVVKDIGRTDKWVVKWIEDGDFKKENYKYFDEENEARAYKQRLMSKYSGVFEESSKCDGPTKKASSDRKNKKWTKCAKQPDGSYKRIHWGDPNAKVTGKSGDTKRKKSFRARHDCKNAKKGSAQEAACKDW